VFKEAGSFPAGRRFYQSFACSLWWWLQVLTGQGARFGPPLSALRVVENRKTDTCEHVYVFGSTRHHIISCRLVMSASDVFAAAWDPELALET